MMDLKIYEVTKQITLTHRIICESEQEAIDYWMDNDSDIKTVITAREIKDERVNPTREKAEALQREKL